MSGFELGLHQAGHETASLCEFDAGAARVLREHFPNVRLTEDVRSLEDVGSVDLASGWKVLRFWEHDNSVRAAFKIERAVKSRSIA